MASTHYINRLERFIYASDDDMEGLVAMWPTMREAAETQGLASAWLLFQPDEHQIGIVTVAAKVAGTDDAENASRSLAALEHSESLVPVPTPELAPHKAFDHTSLNLSLWLSWSATPAAPRRPSQPSPYTPCPQWCEANEISMH